MSPAVNDTSTSTDCRKETIMITSRIIQATASPLKATTFAIPLLLAFLSGASAHADDSMPGPRVSPIARTDSRATAGSAHWDACRVSGEPRVLSARARVRSGVELVSTPTTLALGFTTGPHDAVTMQLDPASNVATHQWSHHSSASIRRTLPLTNGADAALDIAGDSTHLENTRTISGASSIVMGTFDGQLAWAPSATETPTALWRLLAGEVQDLRGVSLEGDAGFSIVFRLNDSLWLGLLDATKKPTGALVKIADGAGIRTPAMAESGGTVLVVWSDASNASDHRTLGAVTVDSSHRVQSIRVHLPAGGSGGDAISPELTANDADGFLLVWTEGPTWTHQVRAVTLDKSGSTVGPALEVSAGRDAGWAHTAIMPDGRGAIVFFASTNDGHAVVATPIACPRMRSSDTTVQASLRTDGRTF